MPISGTPASFAIARYTRLVIASAIGLIAGPLRPPVTFARRGFFFQTSIAIALKVFTRLRTFAPPSIAAFAVTEISSTFGLSLTISGLAIDARTSRTSSRNLPGCVPNVRPSFTFGQLTLSSMAATSDSASIAEQVWT